MAGHVELIQLIIAYTLAGAFVFTVIATCLSLLGIVKFADQKQQQRLFTVLILELMAIGLGFFAGFLKFDPKQVSETIVREDPTRLALATVSALSEEFSRSDIPGSAPLRKEGVLISLKGLTNLDLGDLNSQVNQAVELAESEDFESNRTLISDYTKFVRRSLESRVHPDMLRVGEIRYFIEQLPDLDNENAEDLFESAVTAWRDVAPIRAQKVDDSEDANVLVVTGAEAAGFIAFAELGPPDDRTALRIVFSSEYDWTPQTFKAAASREFGHILGLENSRTAGQLMSIMATPETLPDKPQAEDIKRVRLFWNGTQPVAQPDRE